MSKAPKGKHQHLTLSDRIYIEQGLERQLSLKDIAAFITKDPTTVSKEIRRHRMEKTQKRRTALCIHREQCAKTNMCGYSYCGKKPCGKCTQRSCHAYCDEYRAATCRRLERAPHVCNGCGVRSYRQDTKYYYRAQHADECYRKPCPLRAAGLQAIGAKRIPHDDVLLKTRLLSHP